MVSMPPGLAVVMAPVLGLMLATAPLVLLHVPPDTASAKVVLTPAQILVMPVMAAGDALTVNGAVAIQPAAEV